MIFRWSFFDRPWIRSSIVHRRLVACLLMFAALVMPDIVRADDAATDKAFAALVQQGDRARFAGRNSDAVIAYRNALKIRNDPRIAGRLGMVALKGGATAKSMSYLLRAILEGNRIPQAERLEIESAFNRTLNLVTRVDIDVSLLGADVFIDGQPERLGTTAAEFYVFTLPGKHEVRATLAGHADAVAKIDAPKGGTIRVKLLLTPLNETEHDSTTRETITPNEPCPVCAAPEPVPSSPEPTPPASTKSNHTADDDRIRWMPGLGATVIYGAVSPYPAGGFVLSSHWTAGPIFSGGFDIRVAFSPRGIDDYQIRGGTFTLLPGLCATRERFTGCLVGHLGGMWHSMLSPLPYSTVRVAIGGGASLGFRFGQVGRFDLRATVYGELLSDEYPFRLGRVSQILWTGPPYLTGLSISTVWADRRDGFTTR